MKGKQMPTDHSGALTPDEANAPELTRARMIDGFRGVPNGQLTADEAADKAKAFQAIEELLREENLAGEFRALIQLLAAAQVTAKYLPIQGDKATREAAYRRITNELHLVRGQIRTLADSVGVEY